MNNMLTIVWTIMMTMMVGMAMMLMIMVIYIHDFSDMDLIEILLLFYDNVFAVRWG